MSGKCIIGFLVIMCLLTLFCEADGSTPIPIPVSVVDDKNFVSIRPLLSYANGTKLPDEVIEARVAKYHLYFSACRAFGFTIVFAVATANVLLNCALNGYGFYLIMQFLIIDALDDILWGEKPEDPDEDEVTEKSETTQKSITNTSVTSKTET